MDSSPGAMRRDTIRNAWYVYASPNCQGDLNGWSGYGSKGGAFKLENGKNFVADRGYGVGDGVGRELGV
jgi:hypothetical protein